MITKQELDRLKELEKNATPGPYTWVDYDGITLVGSGVVCEVNSGIQIKDMQFMCASMNLLPKLIESFEVLLKEKEEWLKNK